MLGRFKENVLRRFDAHVLHFSRILRLQLAYLKVAENRAGLTGVRILCSFFSVVLSAISMIQICW